MSTPAENSYGLCEHCVSGHVLPGSPKGKEETVGPYLTYIAQPSSGKPKDDVALVYFYDAFGLNLQNNKILPDQYADKLGITVYVPDLFEGKGVSESLGSAMPGTAKEARAQTFMQKVSSGVKMASMVPWFVSNRPASKYQKVDEFLQTLRSKGYKKIAALGFCYGGHFCIEYNGRGLIDASVAFHPSLWSMKQIEALKNPISFACCEVDQMMSEKQYEQVQQILKKEKASLPCEIKLYPGTVHGNFARPDLSDPQVKSAFESAFAQAVDFLKVHLDLSAPAPTAAGAAAPAAAAAVETAA